MKRLLPALLLALASTAIASMGGYAPSTNPSPRAITIDATKTPPRIIELPGNVRYEPDVAFLPTNRTELADLYFPAEIPKGKNFPPSWSFMAAASTTGTRPGRERSTLPPTSSPTATLP